MKLFLNGSPMDQKTSTFSSVPAGSSFWVGRHQIGPGTYFKGKIAAVKVYKRALTEPEVQDEYERGPEAYAGEAQPYGQNTLNVSMRQGATVMAEYVPAAPSKTMVILR